MAGVVADAEVPPLSSAAWSLVSLVVLSLLMSPESRPSRLVLVLALQALLQLLLSFVNDRVLPVSQHTSSSSRSVVDVQSSTSASADDILVLSSSLSLLFISNNESVVNPLVGILATISGMPSSECLSASLSSSTSHKESVVVSVSCLLLLLHYYFATVADDVSKGMFKLIKD